MLPTSPAKKHSTPGDWHGCFEKISYFSPEVREHKRRKAKPLPPNVKIKPNPLGGPGYVDICLSPYPSYSHEPYDLPKPRRGDRIDSLSQHVLSSTYSNQYETTYIHVVLLF